MISAGAGAWRGRFSVSTVRRAIFVVTTLLALLLSMTLAHRQMKSTKLLWARQTIEKQLDGTVQRPFAYRVLVPTLLHGLDVLPAPLVASIEQKLNPLLRLNLPEDVTPTMKPIYYHGLYIILVVALMVFALTTSATYQALFSPPLWFLPLLTVLTLFATVPFVIEAKPAHTYDFVTLAVWGTLLYALVTERPVLFLVVFTIGCLNKETTALALFPFVACFHDKLPRPRLKLFVAALVALFGLTQGIVHVLRHNNPGTAMERWWKGQILWLVERSFTDLACAVFILALIFRHWRDRPAVLRRATALFPPLVFLYLLGGAPGEMRVFYDALPLVVVLIARNFEEGLMRAFAPKLAESV